MIPFFKKITLALCVSAAVLALSGCGSKAAQETTAPTFEPIVLPTAPKETEAPTNPALLISLGLADVSYSKWFRWSGRFQLMNLILTGLILIFGLAVGY